MVSLCVYLPSLSESDFPGKSLQLAYSLVAQHPTTELYAMQLLLSPPKQPEFKSNSSFHDHNGCLTQHRSLGHKT